MNYPMQNQDNLFHKMKKTMIKTKNKLCLPEYWRDGSLIENFPSTGFLAPDSEDSFRIPNVEVIGS